MRSCDIRFIKEPVKKVGVVERTELSKRVPWGQKSLRLTLPVANVRLTGLSALQQVALEKAYLGFITETAWDIDGDIIECHAYQLDHSPTVSSAALTRDNQYAPRIIHQQTYVIELTGINFVARIRFGPDSAPSSLGVAQEHELPQANVIENFLRVYMAYRALVVSGVMLHSAGLVFDDRAYIFTGRSNAGKTTLTRKAYDKGTWVLSDDINLVLPGKDGYMAHAVPFTGEFGRTLDHRGGKDAYPVAGIILLEQGDQLKTEQVSQSRAVAGLLTGCPFVNTDAQESERLFDSVIGLVAQVPVIRLVSRRDDNVDAIMNAVRKEFDHAKER